MAWKECGDAGVDVDDRPRPDRPVVVRDAQARPSFEHVVHLVLVVDALRVVRAHRERVDADRGRRAAHDLEVELAVLE
jgi:hypothetical protein